MLSEVEVKQFAEDLIIEAADDVRFMDVVEAWSEWADYELTAEDVHRVLKRIGNANIQVTWPDDT